jgi:hypothetical protein
VIPIEKLITEKSPKVDLSTLASVTYPTDKSLDALFSGPSETQEEKLLVGSLFDLSITCDGVLVA